jgi:hypothetical protein
MTRAAAPTQWNESAPHALRARARVHVHTALMRTVRAPHVGVARPWRHALSAFSLGAFTIC